MLFKTTLCVALAALATQCLAAVVDNEGYEIVLKKRADATFDERSTKGEIDYNAIEQELAQLNKKYDMSMKTLEQATGKPHPLRTKAHPTFTKRGSSASVSLQNTSKIAWYGPITVGGHEHDVVFDTALGDTVLSKYAYQPGKNSVNTKQRIDLHWTNGNASGLLYKDSVSFGKLLASMANVVRDDGSDVARQLEGTGASGYVGMSLSALSKTGKTFFDSLMDAHALATPVFSFKISGFANEAKLFIGKRDPFADTAVFSNVLPNSGGFWRTDAGLGTLTTVTPVKVIYDTGASFVVMPVATAKDLFSKLNVETYQIGSTLYASYDCSPTNFPFIYFNIGAYQLPYFSTESITLKQTAPTNCTLSIIGADLGIDGIVMGDAFFKNVDTAFDPVKQRVGFTTRFGLS